MVCRALGDGVRGHQIANLVAALKIHEGPGEKRDTKWKRLFNAVVAAQNRQLDGRPLLRLVGEVMQPVRFGSPEEFEAHRVAVSERLLLSGYRVRGDGKVARVKAAATLPEAQERADVLRAELVQQNYFHAVLEAAKSVAEKLRDISGLDGDGAALIDAACSLSSGPIVAFNSRSTEWERSEQTGLATLLKGLFGTFRNPTAHAPKVRWATSRAEALDMLTLASMLHRRLDGAMVRGKTSP
ncbi:TIGR02391 family protein [soil metagenome]